MLTLHPRVCDVFRQLGLCKSFAIRVKTQVSQMIIPAMMGLNCCHDSDKVISRGVPGIVETMQPLISDAISEDLSA